MGAASYVLVADYFYRDEDGESVTYRRGDKIEGLEDKHATNLLKVGAIAKPSSDAAKRAEDTAPPEVQPGSVEPDGFSQSSALTALANSGLAAEDASGGELDDDQWTEEAELAEKRAAGPGGARPARSATVDEWRRWAVQSGKLSADDAEQANKADLQALK